MTESTPTLYRHNSEAPIDPGAWPLSGERNANGDLLYTFVGDTEPGDAKGASSEWIVDTAAASEPTVVETPTDAVEVTPVADAPSPAPDPLTDVDVADPAEDPSAPVGDPEPSEPVPADPTPAGEPTGDSVANTGTPDGTTVADPATVDPASPSEVVDSTGDEPAADPAPPADAPEDSSEPAGGTVLEPTPVITDLPAPVPGAANTDPDTGTSVNETVTPVVDTTTDPSSEVVPGSSTDGLDNPPVGSAPVAAATDGNDVPVPDIEEPHDGFESDESLVSIKGTSSVPGGYVSVYADGRRVGVASVDDTENWSLEASLPNGDYDLTAQLDDTGRKSPLSDPVKLVVNHDASAPGIAEIEDAEERFVAFIEQRLMKGYALNWEFLGEMRRHAKAWLDSRKSSD